MEKTDPLCRTQTSWETHQACYCPNIAFRVCVCVCCYLSILYIPQRNAPACLPARNPGSSSERRRRRSSRILFPSGNLIIHLSVQLSLRNFLSSSFSFFSLALCFLCMCTIHLFFPWPANSKLWFFFVCDRMWNAQIEKLWHLETYF